MTLPFFQLGLLTIAQVVKTAIVAGSVCSPMSWSPDGEWLSYTTATVADRDEFRPGGFLLTSTVDPDSADHHTQISRETGGPALIYRIWAAPRDRQPSVLIEESQYPLSAPAWNPRGKSVAFGRFVPHSLEPAQAIQKGRYEVIIQDGLDRKHAAWSSAELQLDPRERTQLSHLSCSWSPDGLYLAIPRPGAPTAIEMVRTDNNKRVLILDHASLAAWSPDGSKCAFIRHGQGSHRMDYIERRGQGFGESRPIATVGPIPTFPFWNSDSRSVFAVVEKAVGRTRELEIVRYVLETSETHRVLGLIPEPARRGAIVRGLAIDFDREGERCFFSVDLEGRDADVVWCLPHDRGTIHKRFHPLDVSQRIAGLSISPDGQLVAMRFGSAQGLSAPVIYDSETDQTTLLVPDDVARREWLGDLAGTTRQILAATLPPAVINGQKAERPTLLPLPRELPVHETAIVRLNKLARFGSTLCALAADRPDPDQRPASRMLDAEARLFFDYLRGDYVAASADLEILAPLISSPKMSLSVLSVRAQILLGRGEHTQAKAVIDYLASCGDPNRRLVEETPMGLAFAPAIGPDQFWAQYLSGRAAAAELDAKSPAEGDFPSDVFDPRLQDPALAPLIDRAAGPIPFAPQLPARDLP